MAFNIVDERLKPLFDLTSDGVIILDKIMNVIALNPSAEEITGWKSSEVIGKKFPQENLFHVNSEKNDSGKSGLFSPTDINYELEMEIALSHGNKVLLPAISFPIHGPSGDLLFGLILENVLLRYGVGEKLIKQDRLDEMTGLLHKDYFVQAAKDEIKRMKKHGGTLAAILVWIENLPDIQRKFGNLKRDETVKKMGSLVKGNSRDVDLVCRYGENEFMVLLINTDSNKMDIILNRLKEKLTQSNKNGLFPIPVQIKVGKTLINRNYEEIFEIVKLSLENFI